MDTQTEQLVKDTVNQFVKDGYMFTAFDVTRTLRKAGTTLHHREANHIIKNMFASSEMGSYVRDAVDVNSSQGMPFVYYHPYSDISKYDQDWTNSNPTQNAMKADMTVTPTSTASTSGAYTPPSLDGDGTNGTGAQSASPFVSPSTPTKVPLAKGEHLVTKDGRLHIPIDVVTSKGYIPLQVVYLVVDSAGSKLIVSNIAYHGSSKVFPVKVERDRRIRVCRQVLKNISTGNKFKIDSGLQIEISPA